VALRNSNKNQLVLIENIARSIKEPISEIHDISITASHVVDDEKLISDSLKKITEDSEGIKTTADKIIDASVLDKGKLSLNNGKVNVAALTKEIESIIFPKADNKGINFTVKLKKIKTKDIIIDKERLMQALLSVLDNSVKFTGAGGTIKFTVEEQPCNNMSMARMVFTIKDDGIGMSDEFREIAFDAFTKEDNPLEANLTGVGLGLTIVKRLVELMGGRISLLSKKNLGTEVTITIDCKISYN
jgi:signal transduction histidine kinase